MEYRFQEYLTIDEAVSRLRYEARNTKGTKFFIQVHQQGEVPGTGSYFPIMGNIPVSRKVAIGFIKEAYKNFEHRGARIRISALEKCIFIG